MITKAPKGFFSYFTTPNGRKLVFAGACCTTISLFVGNFLPQTMFLKKYREVITCYQHGIERPVSEKVSKRLEKAFDKLNLHPYERKIIKPFTVYGFDLYQAGSTKYRFGAILGIPVNYYYDTLEDFDKSEVRFRNEPVNWNSEGGKVLQEALILTEEEQIFGLCRAILQLRTHKVLLNSLFPSLTFLVVYTFANYFNERMDLYARPLRFRVILYTLLGLFGLGIWSFTKDFNQVRYDAEVDKALCALGPEFIEAGLSFYDKLLKKNIALHNFMGGDTYTVKGNEKFFLRQKSLPLTIRKSYFEEKLEEMKHLQEQNVEATSI